MSTEKEVIENIAMRELLAKLLPEMECRLAALKVLWPGLTVDAQIERVELVINEIKNFTNT